MSSIGYRPSSPSWRTGQITGKNFRNHSGEPSVKTHLSLPKLHQPSSTSNTSSFFSKLHRKPHAPMAKTTLFEKKRSTLDLPMNDVVIYSSIAASLNTKKSMKHFNKPSQDSDPFNIRSNSVTDRQSSPLLSGFPSKPKEPQLEQNLWVGENQERLTPTPQTNQNGFRINKADTKSFSDIPNEPLTNKKRSSMIISRTPVAGSSVEFNDQMTFSSIVSAKNKTVFLVKNDMLTRGKEFFSQYRLAHPKVPIQRKRERTPKRSEASVTSIKNNETQAVGAVCQYQDYLEEINEKSLLPLNAEKLIHNSTFMMMNFSIMKEEYGIAFGKFLRENGRNIRHILFEKTLFPDACMSSLLVSGLRGDQTKFEGGTLKKLESLRFISSPIGPMVSKGLQELMSTSCFSSATEIAFSDCSFRSASFTNMILEGLMGSPMNLLTLNFNGNNFQPFNVHSLCDLLKKKAGTIQNLNISRLFLQANDHLKVLGSIRDSFKSLIQLNLSHNSIGTVEATRCVSEILASNPKLLHLDVSNCNLDSEKTSLLVSQLADSSHESPLTSLLSLHLGGNPLSRDDILSFLAKLNKTGLSSLPTSPAFDLFSQEIVSLSDDRFIQLHSPNFNQDIQEACFVHRSMNVKLRRAKPKKDSKLDVNEHRRAEEKLVFFRSLERDNYQKGHWFAGKNCFICERWSRMKITSSFSFQSQLVPEDNVRRIKKSLMRHEITIPDEAPKAISLEQEGRMGEQVCLNKDVFIGFKFLQDVPLHFPVNPESGHHEFFFYFPPGTHKYQFYVKRNGFEQIYENSFEAVANPTNPTVNLQAMTPMKTSRFFQIDQSIFRNFQPEGDQAIEKAVSIDVARSGISDLVKSVHEQEKVLRVFQRLFQKIYSVYMTYSIQSAYPLMNLNSFKKMLWESKLFDKTISPGIVHQEASEALGLFDNEKQKKYSIDESINSELVPRYAFIDLLLRISIIKYYKTGRCDSPSLALDKFLRKDLIPGLEELAFVGETVRETDLFTLGMNDVFECNMDGLTRIFKKFKGENEQIQGEVLSEKILKEILGVKMEPQKEKEKFVYSKKIICDEIKQKNEFNGLSFGEFLVWIGFISLSEELRDKFKGKESNEGWVLRVFERLFGHIRVKVMGPPS